jgi:phosphoglycolate phosphatase
LSRWRSFELSLPFKAVIFDLDGTLVNSKIQYKEMKRQVIKHLEAVGVAPRLLNDEMLNFEITKTALQDMRQKDYTQQLIQQAFDEVSEIMNDYELKSVDEATSIPGVLETLQTLKAHKVKLGVMTRSCREYAEKLLSKFGLRSFFDAVVARDDVARPKPNPEHALYLLRLLGVLPQEALYVGDHWSDAECASKAGLKFVLVGRRRKDYVERVRELGFEAIDEINEIANLLF